MSAVMGQPMRRPAFDWDVAREMRAAGATYVKIAADLGVSAGAVRRVCVPERLARTRETAKAYSAAHNADHRTLCPCGRSMRWHDHRCRVCQSEAQTTSVRTNSLRCSTCREWKPDEAFSPSPRCIPRRGRHRDCKACQSAHKRAARARAKAAA